MGHKNAEWYSGTKRFRIPDPKPAVRRSAERQFVGMTFSPYKLCKFSKMLSYRFCDVKRRIKETLELTKIQKWIISPWLLYPVKRPYPTQRELWEFARLLRKVRNILPSFSETRMLRFAHSDGTLRFFSNVKDLSKSHSARYLWIHVCTRKNIFSRK